MKAIILCAGYATRLYPLTLNKPKPLLEVAGEPIVNHIIKKLEEVKEINEIFIVTNAKFYGVFEDWRLSFNSSKKIKIINDNTTSNEDRLGSLGDVNFVLEKENVNESVMIVAGDNLFEFSLKNIVESYNKNKLSTIVLYDVQDKELAKQYGIVQVDDKGIIIDFKEKPSVPKSTLSSTGIYIYPYYVLLKISDFVNKFNNSDKAGNFLEKLHKEEQVYGYITKEKWFDIGSLEQLEKAQREMKL